MRLILIDPLSEVHLNLEALWDLLLLCPGDAIFIAEPLLLVAVFVYNNINVFE